MIDLSASISLPVLRWASNIWTKWKNKISEEEKDLLLQTEIQNRLISWDESDGKHVLSILQKLVKKGVLQEGYKSPSGVLRNFTFTDSGSDLYRSILLSTKSNVVSAIKSTKHIFPEKIALSSHTSKEDVMRVINELEEMGKVKPCNSHNRGTLFWTNQ